MNRFFEMIPGILTWATLILIPILSWRAPVFAAFFIIAFDTYWLLKTIYLSFHLRATFNRMREYTQTDWLASLRAGGGKWEEVYHLVIFPMYHEPLSVVRESFVRLAATQYPKHRFIVVLALEERAGNEAQETARAIEREFGDTFHALITTTHPANVPGELAGKGSNEAWAAEHALQQIIRPQQIPVERVLVSVFDVDTQVFPQYFGRLTHAFLHTEKPLRAIYQPIPFFTNNVYESPAIARVVAFSCTFWQMMQQSRPERLTTFSSQSIPLPVLIDIGFWDRDIVSEDSRVFWQGYLRYDGDFCVVPLFYPVSMDANVAPTLWGTLVNLYKQQRRWAWGAENVPYVLEGFRQNRRIPIRTKIYWVFHKIEGFHSWATNSIIIFALGWLPIWLGVNKFDETLLAYNLPKITGFIIQLSMLGIATSAVLGIVLLPPRPTWFRLRHYALYVLQWALIPITLILFGSIPAIDAQTRLLVGGRWRLGFWVTPKGRYTSASRRTEKR